MTKLTATDGHTFDAHEVIPEGAGAAIVIVQEIFGVNAHIRSVVERYAALGYHAIAPALFDRAGPGIELDYGGGQIHELIDLAPTAPTMLHFGELDHAIPLDQVEGIAAAHPDVPVHVYAGAQHGFNCDARGSYDAISATIALGRTVEFLVANGVRP